MAEWKIRRFWKDAQVVEKAEGFSVALDGRSVRTPAKRELLLPTRAVAQAVANEWVAQQGEVNPAVMPVTRASNAAIDKVAIQYQEVAGLIAAYGGSDLLCYRAVSPEELTQRQAEKWDPLLDWAHDAFGARLKTVQGVMPVAQNPAALKCLSREVFAMSAFELTAFHDLVSMSGSLVIGLAVIRNYASPSELWRISRVDEDWQQEHWGVDEEAQEAAAVKESEFWAAKHFNDLVRSDH